MKKEEPGLSPYKKETNTNIEALLERQINALESISASILLHAQIQSGTVCLQDILDDSGVSLLAQAKRAAHNLRLFSSREKIEARAYQLFERDKPMSLNETAKRFREAKWPRLGSKGSVKTLLTELSEELRVQIKRIPKQTAYKFREMGESKIGAMALAHRKETLTQRLNETKVAGKHVPYNLLLLAAELDVRQDELTAGVDPEKIVNPAARNPYGIQAGELCPEQVPVERFAFIVVEELNQLRAEVSRLRHDAKKSASPRKKQSL